MESSLKQFISSANGANHDHSELSTSPKSSPPPASPKKFSALPVISKIPIITPHTQLTGEAALANRIRSQSPKHMSDEIETKRERPQESPADTQVSPNPAAAVLSNYPMSRPTDVPNREDSPASHKGLAALPSIATAANAMDTSGGSPNTATSMTTNGSAGDSSATPATAGSGGTTDPALLHPNDTNHPSYQPIGLHQNRSNSLSDQFSATTPTTPGGFAHTPTTPYSPSTPGGSRGKHTCHHCNQTFTRHHNLKSHLLTHSHEKPFLCSTCQARFRRLHDLKRHSKLHTGERPHVCNKCGRKFARGDALARHARAEGGCAGRRSSMAGMLNEDGSIVQGLGVDQEDGMEGLEGLIGADPDGDVDMMGSDGGTGGSRRRSLPSIRTDFSNAGNAPGNPITPASGASTFSHTPTPHHSNTYPTLNTPRNTASTSGPSPASGASLFAPHLGVKPNTSSATSPMQTSATTVASATPTSGVAATGGSILSPHGIMSDSPRASSPSAMTQEASGRDRTPSFGYMTGLTPTSHAPPQQPQQQTQQPQPQPQPTQQPAPQREAPTSAPTANMGGGPAPSHTNNMFTSPEAIWGYIKSLEDRIRSLEATVVEMKQERQNQPQAQQQQQRPAIPNTANQDSGS